MGLKEFFDKKTKNSLERLSLNWKDMKNKTISVTKNYLSNFYYNYMSRQNDFIGRFDDYISMWCDPIIFNALEFIVDDATQFSPLTRKKIWSSLDNKEYQEIADNLFSDLGIDEDCWNHFAKLCMFGNCPVRLYYATPDFTGGITSIEIEENLFRYIPVEINGVVIKYIDKYTDKLLEPFEVVFGRINVLNVVGVLTNYYDFNISRNNIIDVDNSKGTVIKNTFKYGTSMFENIRRVWRQLKLLEDNMILTRLDRSPSLKIFEYDTEGMNTQTAIEAGEFYNDLINKDDRILSVNDDLLRGTNGQLGYGTNILLPRSGERGLKITPFPGEAEVHAIVDVDHFTDKFFSGLKVPREFLGLKDKSGGISIGDNSLQRKEIRYARTVKKLQFGGMKMYKDILYYHLLSLKKDVKYDDINIIMNIVSTAEDEEFKNALSNSMTTVNSFTGLLNNVKNFMLDNAVEEKTRNYLLDYLTTRMLNSNDFNFKKFFKDVFKHEDEIVDREGKEKRDEKEKERIEKDIDKQQDTIDKKKDEDEKEQKKAQEKQLKEVKEAFRKAGPNVIFGLKNIFEKYDMIKFNPVFSKDKNLKYCENIFKKSESKYILENFKSKKISLDKDNLKTVLEKLSGFDISMFGLKNEYKNLDISNYHIESKQDIKEIDLRVIYFTELLFEKQHILNFATVEEKVTIFDLEGKLYCNYSNGCKLFRNIFEGNKMSFNVVKLGNKNS